MASSHIDNTRRSHEPNGSGVLVGAYHTIHPSRSFICTRLRAKARSRVPNGTRLASPVYKKPKSTILGIFRHAYSTSAQPVSVGGKWDNWDNRYVGVFVDFSIFKL